MGGGVARLRAVVRQGWSSPARRLSTENSLQEPEPFEELGIDDITSLITNKCRMLLNPTAGVKGEDDLEENPVHFFQKCWGWSSSDGCSYEDSPPASSSSTLSSSSSSSSSPASRGPSVLSRKQRMVEISLLQDIAISIMQQGWNPNTQQEFRAKLPELTSFHVCHILKAMQDPDLCMQVFKWANEQPNYRHTTRSYNALFGMLAGRKGALVLDHLIEEMTKDGCEADSVTLCTLIKAYSKLQQSDKVLQLYGQMRDKEWVPGMVTYSCIIDLLAKNGYTDKAREVYFEMRMSGCYLDRTGYNIIINLFGRKKNLHMVYRLLHDMRACGLHPDGYTYAALIQAHLKLGDALNAHELFQEARNKKLTMTLATCTALIYALGKAGEINLAMHVYHQMETIGLQPDILTYSTIVGAIGQENQISDLVRIINDMMSKGSMEIGSVHTYVVGWLVRGGKVVTACKLVLEITKQQQKPHNTAVEALLQNFVKMGAIDEIHRFVKKLAAVGFGLNASKLSDLVKSLSEAGNVDGALKIFYMMQEFGYRADAPLFNSIIICLSKFGSLYQALRFFDDMNEIGLSPSTQTCNNLIHMLCVKGNMKCATEVFSKMRPGTRNVDSYNQLIAGYANLKNWAMAFKLSKDMEDNGLAPDSDTYTALIFSLVNEEQIGHALQLCKQMLDKGLKPSSLACMKLLELLSRKGCEDEAHCTFKKLQTMGEFGGFPDYDSYLVQRQTS